MAISKNLEIKFQMIEFAGFEEWKKSSEKERLNLCKKIGRWEAKEIIKEIENEHQN